MAQQRMDEFYSPRPGSLGGALGGLFLTGCIIVGYCALGLGALAVLGFGLKFLLGIVGLPPSLIHGTLFIGGALFVAVGAALHCSRKSAGGSLFRAADDIDG